MTPLTQRPSIARLALPLCALSALAAVGCDPDECDPGSARATRAALVPAGQPVHCENSVSFAVGDRRVRFSHVEYGQEMDCPSGCFASHVCAIEDRGQVFLYYAAWNLGEERPLTLEAECPGLENMETWPGCEPSGRLHELNDLPRFRSFAEQEEGVGPFRWCVNRFFE